MENYDYKSLQELQDIARIKYNLELPANFTLGDAIEWMHMQDAIGENRIDTGINGIIVPSPVQIPTTPRSPPITATIIPTTFIPTTFIPTIPGIETLGKEDDSPIIAPIVPTKATIPTLPIIPTLPTLPSFPFLQVPAQKYFLNDENTLRTLHGTPQLPWQTDLATLNAARNQENPVTANPNAAFQGQVLHPNYRPMTPITIANIGMPSIPLINIMVPKPTTHNVPMIPVINTTVDNPITPNIPILTRIVSPPKILPISPPKVISPPKAPIRVASPPIPVASHSY